MDAYQTKKIHGRQSAWHWKSIEVTVLFQSPFWLIWGTQVSEFALNSFILTTNWYPYIKNTSYIYIILYINFNGVCLFRNHGPFRTSEAARRQGWSHLCHNYVNSIVNPGLVDAAAAAHGKTIWILQPFTVQNFGPEGAWKLENSGFCISYCRLLRTEAPLSSILHLKKQIK